MRASHKQIIALYGEMLCLEDKNKCMATTHAEASLEIKNQFVDNIEGYGTDIDEAITNLYIKLGEIMARAVELIEDGR